ncbi:hypothetical protein J7E99_13685 [Streptomyces sp. ISL-44]|uniref:hypothetical protein n=1 Tax=unclassified Streptomyces TaxID=2593676 RepID=UPI001BEC8175|nr:MULTISPECIES: hypothetical protein [unclassified Streptomyces]MBT2541731.1 hypothetical protein [Streptomyces sp. ISL-44]MCX5013441.1 hypothetical protein [Streptomyces sp. NBC_00555]MCX5607477.1 hypothetical protein [Streptomyces sp. NBC_00047]
MSAERAQGRGWVRIPASRAEQPATSRATGYDRGPYATAPHTVQPPIYLSLVKRWREAGRTLPGHPDEEWERLISQPCWPGR